MNLRVGVKGAEPVLAIADGRIWARGDPIRLIADPLPHDGPTDVELLEDLR